MQNLSRTGSFSLLAVACLTIMVGCVIVPGLPTIARQLGVEHAASWLVTVPSLGVIVCGAIAAKLIERSGLYTALCLGLFSYGLLGATGFMLHGPIAVFTDRLLLGGSTALVMAAGTGLISEFYEGKARLTMIASQGMAIELGGVIFLFIGGLLASVGWRWPFALYLTAWIFLALILIFVPRPENHLRAVHSGERNRRVSTALRVVFTLALLSMLVFFTAIIMLPLRLHDLNFKEAQVGYFLSFTSLVAVGAAALMPGTARSTRGQLLPNAASMNTWQIKRIRAFHDCHNDSHAPSPCSSSPRMLPFGIHRQFVCLQIASGETLRMFRRPTLFRRMVG